MRVLNRNKQTVWYALYDGSTDEVDEYGDYTGVKIPKYTEPVELKGNLSASRGTSDSELFGIDVQYSRTLCVDELDCPLKEDSILWVNADPKSASYNYVVVAVAKSLNNIVYALKEVKTSFTPTPEPTPTPDPEPDEPVDPNDQEQDDG